MEYFILSPSTLTEEIGKEYPQCKGVPSGYTFKWFENVNSMTKLSNEQFPDFIPDLKFELEEVAKLSDMISPSNISAEGMLCSLKMLNLLEGCIMEPHKVFDAEILFNNAWHKYHWIHFVKRDIDFIDMENSIFHKWLSGIFKDDEVHFNTYEQANKIIVKNDYCSIKPSKLVIKERYIEIMKGVFYISFMNRIVIDETVHELIRKNKITGVHLEHIK